MTEMPADNPALEPLLTDAQVSSVLKVPLPTLAAWRCNGRVKGLPFVKIGGAIRYRRADVERFIQSNVTQPGETF